MAEFSSEEKIILVQYGIKKYENEDIVIEKLKDILSEKDVQRNIAVSYTHLTLPTICSV